MAVSLRGLRHNRGLTIKVAAERIDISPQTLLDAELGKTEPHVTFKHKIASFYNQQVTDIWPVPDTERAA
jgi:DNA-binding XRE family transcriptional regulator